MVLEVVRSSAEAVADEEKNFDMSADSLKLKCKRVRLDSNARRVDSELYPQQGDIVETQKDEGLPDRLGSPDESLKSKVFVLKENAANEEFVTSSRILEDLERVKQENSSTNFVSPPGPLKKINVQQISPLNKLEGKRDSARATTTMTSTLRPKSTKITVLIRPKE